MLAILMAVIAFLAAVANLGIGNVTGVLFWLAVSQAWLIAGYLKRK